MATAQREFYTAEEYAAAKTADVARYLQSIGYELKQENRDYRGKLHDSLVIRGDGRWAWNSKDVKGHSPIELLKQILIYDYGYGDEITAAIEAVKRLAGTQGMAYTAQKTVQPQNNRSLAAPQRELFTGAIVLPEANKSVSRVGAYLCNTRGLDSDIVKELIQQKKIYESKDFHNAVFVSYDKENKPRHAFMRGTYSLSENQFKKEAPASDKSYPFTLPGRSESDRVFCFEAAIDAISHASLYKRYYGEQWRDDNRIALGGTSFLGLDRFLDENTQVKHITVCLDNDVTGLRRGKKLQVEYTEKGYIVGIEHPFSKDYNEELLTAIREDAKLEERDGEMET